VSKQKDKSGSWLIWLALGLVACAGVGAVIAVALYRWHEAAGLARAREAFKQKQYQLAAALAERYINAGHPGDAEAKLLAARSYALVGRWELAEAYFAQVPLQRREDLHLRARGLMARELWSEAAAVYEQVLKRWPTDPTALKNMAIIRMQQNRPLESLVFARQLAQIREQRVTALLIQGYIQTHLGNEERAIKVFEEALKLSPDLPEEPNGPGVVYQLLARAYLDVGNPAKAEQYALKARAVTADPEPCWILGRVKQIAGDERAAEAYWQEALARSPDHAESLVDLAQLYLRRGQLQQALRFAERASQVSPETESVQRLLRALRARIRRLSNRERPGGEPAAGRQRGEAAAGPTDRASSQEQAGLTSSP